MEKESDLSKHEVEKPEESQHHEGASDKKFVVILGAVNWFGFECAKTILKGHKDWVVFLADDKEDLGMQSIKRLNDEHGLEAQFHPLDVNSEESIVKFRDFITEKAAGGINVLISNIGLLANVSPQEGGSKLDEATFKDTIRIAYFGTLAVCKELLPLMNEHDGKVIMVSSRFAQAAYMHSKEDLQRRFRECQTIDQVNELMEQLKSSDVDTIKSYLADPPDTKIVGNYTLGGLYAYGIAKLGLNILVQCYQRQFEEEKSATRVAINAVCPGLERPDKPLEEAVDTVEWLALEQTPDSDVRGQFVADRKVIDQFTISSDAELL